jgi:hypothetical protein
MLAGGESQKEVIRPNFNRAIMIDFQGATISSDTGFILLREIDDRFRIIDPMKEFLEDLRSPVHTKHALVQVVRQRVYQIAAGYEDCNDAHPEQRGWAAGLGGCPDPKAEREKWKGRNARNDFKK